MKKIIALIVLFTSSTATIACDPCTLAQPRFFRGITHGAGPESQWDFLIIAVASVVVVYTFFFSMKWILFPGEKSKNHIKQTVLNFA